MLLSDAEIEDLCTAICMKPGHRKRFPVLIKREREQAEREQLLIKREREKAEREREQAEREEPRRRIVLPEGKRFGCFISHKVGE